MTSFSFYLLTHYFQGSSSFSGSKENVGNVSTLKAIDFDEILTMTAYLNEKVNLLWLSILKYMCLIHCLLLKCVQPANVVLCRVKQFCQTSEIHAGIGSCFGFSTSNPAPLLGCLGKAAEDGPLATHRGPGWGFWLLASAWPIPGHCSHVGSNPVDARLSLSVLTSKAN